MSGTERLEGCFTAFDVHVGLEADVGFDLDEILSTVTRALAETDAFYRLDLAGSSSRLVSYAHRRTPDSPTLVPEQWSVRLAFSVLPRDPAVRGPRACRDLDEVLTAAVTGVVPGAGRERVSVSLATAAALLASTEEEYAALPGPEDRPRPYPVPPPPREEESEAVANDPAWDVVYPRELSTPSFLSSYLHHRFTPAEAGVVEDVIAAHVGAVADDPEAVLFPRPLYDHDGVVGDVRRHLDEHPGVTPVEAARAVLGW